MSNNQFNKQQLRVVIEPRAEPHGAGLYDAQVSTAGYRGFASAESDGLQEYRSQGYLLIRRAFPGELVDRARDALREIGLSDRPACESIYFEGSIRDALAEVPTQEQNQTDPAFAALALGVTCNSLPPLDAERRLSYVRKFMGFTRSQNPALKTLAEYPPLLDLMGRLLGGTRPHLYQDMAMIKPPGGREKPWHQDRAYFNFSLETPLVGVWVAIDPATPENGCMRVVPGGHRAGPSIHFMRRDWQICDSDSEVFRPLAIPMESGDCLVFDGLLPHGTPRNGTSRRRWALQYHYTPPGVEEAPDQERLNVFGSEGKNVTC